MTTCSRQDAELDLRWFYQEAGGAFGLRSVLGPQLDALRFGTSSKGPLQFSDDMIEKLALHRQDIERMCEVSRRLMRLSLSQRRVLEQAFSSPHMFADVPMGLAVAQASAIESHASVIKELANHPLRPSKGLVRSVATRQQQRKRRMTTGMTVAGWLEAALIVSKQSGGEHCAELVTKVAQETRTALTLALVAYCAVDVP